MKRDYLALLSLLATAFVIFFALSTCQRIDLGFMELKTSNMAQAVFGDNARFASSQADSATTDTVPSTAAAESEPKQVILDSSPKTLLIIGDSMLEGLAPRLGAYCDASGYKLYAAIWYSSTSQLYGESKLLTDYIRKYQPDFIFLSLGGNELFVSDVANKRTKYVKSILDEIGDIPFVWIGPPNWKPDTGINNVIAQTVPDGCFFLSDGMTFERKRDGAHPTAKSAAVWMDSVVRWMPAHARYVLPFEQPEQKSVKPTRLFLHQPGELTFRPQ